MTIHRTPQQVLKEAKQIARDHGCFVVEKGGRYQVYRSTNPKPTWLGNRNTPEALHRLVCKVTQFR